MKTKKITKTYLQWNFLDIVMLHPRYPVCINHIRGIDVFWRKLSRTIFQIYINMYINILININEPNLYRSNTVLYKTVFKCAVFNTGIGYLTIYKGL